MLNSQYRPPLVMDLENSQLYWIVFFTLNIFRCLLQPRQKSIAYYVSVQVNLCQKLLFLHQLTHNMTTDCSLNYKFNTWKFQAQTWGEHVVYRNCFWHSEQFLYTTCSPHVLQKEELLTKIYLYRWREKRAGCQNWGFMSPIQQQPWQPLHRWIL